MNAPEHRSARCSVRWIVITHAVTVCLAAAAMDSEARELWARGEASLEFSGSFRELLLYGTQTDANDFARAIANDLPTCVQAATFPDCAAFDTVGQADGFQSLSRLRLRFDLRVTQWLSAALVWDNDVVAGQLDTLANALGPGFEQDTFFGAEWTLVDKSHVAYQMSLYRAYLHLETERVDAVIGRQRVAWGVGRLWNPIDRFNAIPPLAIQPDQNPGIDGVAARWLFDGFNFLEVVYAPGTNRDEARAAVRLHGVLWDADISIMGGVFEKAATAGFDVSRNLGDAVVRLEAVYTNPELSVWRIGDPAPAEVGDFWQVVAGIDNNFSVGNGLYVVLEYLYNGNALGFGEARAGPLLAFFESTLDPPAPGVENIAQPPYVTIGSPAIFGGSRVVSAGRHLTGLSMGYDFTPELTANFLAIYDWDGTSAVFFPTLRYSPLGWLEATLGFQAGVGPRHSEYGERGELVYLLADFFF